MFLYEPPGIINDRSLASNRSLDLLRFRPFNATDPELLAHYELSLHNKAFFIKWHDDRVAVGPRATPVLDDLANGHTFNIDTFNVSIDGASNGNLFDNLADDDIAGVTACGLTDESFLVELNSLIASVNSLIRRILIVPARRATGDRSVG